MGNWIDFAWIKQAVPLLALLEQYQIAGLRRSGISGAVFAHCTAAKAGMRFM
jgi:hypothetical protein